MSTHRVPQNQAKTRSRFLKPGSEVYMGNPSAGFSRRSCKPPHCVTPGSHTNASRGLGSGSSRPLDSVSLFSPVIGGNSEQFLRIGPATVSLFLWVHTWSPSTGARLFSHLTVFTWFLCFCLFITDGDLFNCVCIIAQTLCEYMLLSVLFECICSEFCLLNLEPVESCSS